MGSMDAAEGFAAAREEGEAVVSGGRQASHAGQSRKKSFKARKAHAHSHKHTKQTTHVQPITHPSSVPSARHSPRFGCLVISLVPLAVLVLGLAEVLWSDGIEPVLA